MYENKFPNYDPNSKGLAVIALANGANVFAAYPGFGYGVTVKANSRVGFLTGRWVKENDINYVQIAFESVLKDDEGETFMYGCVDALEYRTANMGTSTGATSMINALIENNKVILENNLLCAGMLSYMETNKIDVPIAAKKNIYALQTRLMVRNEKILSSSFIDTKKTAAPVGFSKYGNSLNTLMQTDNAVGIVPIVIYLVVSVVFTLLVSAILYLIFKPDYTDSKADLKVSEDLTKALATLSPEARTAVLADLNGQVDEAYVKGKLDGSGMGMLKTAGLFAAGVLGFVVIDKFISKRGDK